MSFITVIASALTVLRKHADFDSTNTTGGDLRPMAAGKGRVVSITYGGLTTEELTLTQLRHRWTLNVDLLVPWKGTQDTWETNLSTERQKVIDTFAAWPNLDASSGVIMALLDIGNEPDLMSEPNGAYRGQRLILTVDELVDSARLE